MDKFLNMIIICVLIYLCLSVFYNGENNSLKLNISDLIHNTLIVKVDNSSSISNYNFNQQNDNTITSTQPITK